MKKIALITGITGQDGSYLSELLLSKEYEVHGIVRRHSTICTDRIDHILSDSSFKDRFFLHYGDLTDSSCLSNLIKEIQPDEVYNLAAQSHVGVSFEVPEYTAEATGVSTIKLLEAIRQSKSDCKFYQASTSELFGGIPDTAPQSETTPFYPKSPYGAAKLYSYWITVNYREAYNMFACNGILFNHESPRRGEEFVTRKITIAVAKIIAGKQDKLSLGNLNAKRDWGYAGDYVEGMWLMLQQDKPDDYVLATNETHTVREFVEAAFEEVGINFEWRGTGVDEKGYDSKTGKLLVDVNPKYFRPAEVELLLGDPAKAEKQLAWKRKINFRELVKMMIAADRENIHTPPPNNVNKFRIGIVGLGYVGLTLAIAAAEHDFEVFGIEINPFIKSCLKENHAHFYEPNLDDLISLHNNKNFYCVDEFPVDKKFDAFIITVGTPLNPGSKEPNFTAITAAIKSISKVYDGSQLIILRSTVSVGTTRKVVMPFLSKLCNKKEILVSMCPERTVEGKAIEELTHLPQVISGNNPNAIEFARKIFLKITDSIIEADSLEEAELIKLYCNTYRDMNFAIGNAFCLAAQTFRVDGTRVIKNANEGYSRARIALPGFVAGPCLEKDAYILTNNMTNCISRDFILNARNINESLENEVVNWVRKYIGNPSDDKLLTLSGMAFKGRPDTSDLRGSSSVNIARKLKMLGYKLKLHDFVADIGEMSSLGFGNAYSDLEAACVNSSALLILNNHRHYSEIKSIATSRKNFIILDIWDVCSKIDNTYDVYTLGNMNLVGGVAI